MLLATGIASSRQYVATSLYWHCSDCRNTRWTVLYLSLPADDGLTMTSKLTLSTFQSRENVERMRRGKCAAGVFLKLELAESADWE